MFGTVLHSYTNLIFEGKAISLLFEWSYIMSMGLWDGAVTLNITTFSIMTFTITTFSIITLRIMAFLRHLVLLRLSINNTQRSITALCLKLHVIMLSVVFNLLLC